MEQEILVVQSVHPRVGGEHIPEHLSEPRHYGSSPRGRGTLHKQAGANRSDRFIPAWAGNTCKDGFKVFEIPVHPRVGGEHVNPQRPGVKGRGSSPAVLSMAPTGFGWRLKGRGGEVEVVKQPLAVELLS